MAASTAQADFADKLIKERVVSPEMLNAVAVAKAAMTPKQFSDIVTTLLALPKAAVAVLEPGTYYVNEKVYQVVSSKAGNPYAKVMDEAGKFVYDKGAIYKLPADAKRVTVQEAIAYGLKFGHCVHCGHGLKKEDSILLAIGPVCAKREHGLTQKQLIAAMLAVQPQAVPARVTQREDALF